MRQDRFLVGILVGIAVLVVLALVVFFVRRGSLSYGPDDTPDGVVRNYIVALQKQDYERAYSYMADIVQKPSLAAFTQPLAGPQAQEIASTSLEITSVNVDASGNSATILVSMVRGPTGLFTNNPVDLQTADLVRQNGAWKIRNLPYPFWSYNWSVPVEAKPVPLDTLTPVPTVTPTP
jgi:hypothetical protein